MKGKMRHFFPWTYDEVELLLTLGMNVFPLSLVVELMKKRKEGNAEDCQFLHVSVFIFPYYNAA